MEIASAGRLLNYSEPAARVPDWKGKACCGFMWCCPVADQRHRTLQLPTIGGRPCVLAREERTHPP